MGQNTGYLTANRTKSGDEWLTPDYAVKPLLKYLEKFSLEHGITIWCPFDEEDSAFVRILGKKYKVIATHIFNEQDFFTYEPEEHYDIIISNPPFSQKDAVLKRLYELDAAYAILLPLPTLQGQKRFEYIKDSQVLVFDKRINYISYDAAKESVKSPSFGSIFLCRYFLPKDLIFEELEKE